MTSESQSNLSLLDVLNLCDNCQINRPSVVPSSFDSEVLIPFCLSSEPNSPAIGLIRPIVLAQLEKENADDIRNNRQPLWDIRLATEPNSESDAPSTRVSQYRTDGGSGPVRPSVSFASEINTHHKRTAAMKALCERWRDTGVFDGVCGPRKWRNEMYPVYRDPFGVHDYPNATIGDGEDSGDLNYAFEMERSACALFGVVTYGVHLSLFQSAKESLDATGPPPVHIWVPTRAMSKQTFPGMLDNSVAGGIPSGMGIFDSLVKECMEEASLPEDLVKRHARAVGAISYFYRTSAGWLQPEIEYVYDMSMPPDADLGLFTPKPLDGEVESFEFLSEESVLTALRAGKFKPNCGLVLIDLLMRLGHVTPDNEPDYMQIVTRMHNRFDYERW
ncbi:hypothetical protein HGRIS_012246 [Hohenbuehelia grisea]|uniref:Nudix hydrolase domain-containing protein n=1 Tax=Hohenbuehelia grisea TaxID=104357 RepID=A0ABR3IRS4_9AGAR